MKARQLKIVTGYRNEKLKINLGKIFTGVLTAWMAREDSGLKGTSYRSFAIDSDNKGITMSQDKMKDYVDAQDVIVEFVAGTWLFDVKEVPLNGAADDIKVVLQGRIVIINDNTGAHTIVQSIEQY